MSLDWNDAAIADSHICAALAKVVATIDSDPRPLADVREEDLRGALYRALERLLLVGRGNDADDLARQLLGPARGLEKVGAHLLSGPAGEADGLLGA